ncbi:MAG: SMC-Scp complex subunit ScpB [Gemmatimonadaceae bacterium]|nr:SMC-Scp complex subunit ScpB [Gemmatimonadaceae bacterium]
MIPLAKLLEAALFSSAHPVGLPDLRTVARDGETSESQILSALDDLRRHYDEDGHGVELIEVAGGWQILTRPEYTETIERAQLAARPQRLSAAALETLAIIAYRQPIGRGDIEEVRGVGCGQMLKSLHERELIEVVGRGEGMGRPLLYGTTPGFLEQFALRHLGELPRADELAVALRDPTGEGADRAEKATRDEERISAKVRANAAPQATAVEGANHSEAHGAVSPYTAAGG